MQMEGGNMFVVGVGDIEKIVGDGYVLWVDQLEFGEIGIVMKNVVMVDMKLLFYVVGDD